jgi:hypothetical protein
MVRINILKIRFLLPLLSFLILLIHKAQPNAKGIPPANLMYFPHVTLEATKRLSLNLIILTLGETSVGKIPTNARIDTALQVANDLSSD